MKVTYDPKNLGRALDMATRIAPTAKGGAWDKAAGMVIDVESDGSTTVLATNIDVSMSMSFDCLEIEDAPEDTTRWRMSSLFLANFIKKLNGTITFTPKPEQNAVLVSSGRSRLQVPLMDATDYPKFADPPGEAPVDGASMAVMADRVLWACDGSANNTPLAGIHADGVNIVGCRHEGLGMIGYPMKLSKPITFQGRELMSLVKGFHDVKVSADDKQVFLWLSETDWVSASLIVAPYPQYDRLRRDDYAGVVQMQRAAVLDCLERMSIIAGQDRGDLPRAVVTIGRDTFHMKLEIVGVAECEETLPIANGPDPAFTAAYSLGFLSSAVQATVDEEFQFHFGSTKRPNDAHLMSVKITDPSGWEGMLMPRRT